MSGIIKKTVRLVVPKNIRTKYVNNRNIRLLYREKEKNGKKYLFTVIIPVYNAEAFLDETMESLINQTIGFENIQVILVDDGSTDGSGEKCKHYAEIFDNVEYYSQINGGASSARNHGLKYVNGLYVNFLDSDDKWDEKAFEEVVKFLYKFGQLKIVAAKERFFEAAEGEHPRNFVFKRDKVCDLEKNFTYAPLSSPQSFFRFDALDGLRFNEKLHHGEDALFTTEILLKTMSFGAMKAPIYYYRKHNNNASSSNTIVLSDHYYTEALTLYHDYLMEKSVSLYGSVPKFVQYELAYNIGWRIKDSNARKIDKILLHDYKNHLIKILKQIDDEAIITQKHIGLNHKLYMLSLKYGWNYDTAINDLMVEDDMIVCRMEGQTHPLQRISQGLRRVTIQFIRPDYEPGKLIVEGTFNALGIPSSVVQTYININGEQYEAEVYPKRHGRFVFSFDEYQYSNLHFRASVPLSDKMKFKILFSIKNSEIVEANMLFGRFVPLNESLADVSYGIKDGYLYRLEDKCVLMEKKDDTDIPERLEEAYCAALEKETKAKSAIELRKKYFSNHDARKKLWLFTDRMTSAEDSGEVMFKFVNEHPIQNVETAFIIRDDVPDYERLKKIGRVIPFNSEEHKLAVLEADKIISSAAENNILYPFGKEILYLKDLCTFKFVFLQHGVIKDDLSGWLHRANKNIELFITSAEREKQSIIDAPYGYTEKEVVVTGLPRFDNFVGDGVASDDRSIYVMPTWREWLAPVFNVSAEDVADIQTRKSGFRDSSYFLFYNGLLKNKKLHSLLEKTDYHLYFALHPRMGAEMDSFFKNDRIHLLKPESFSYGDAFKSMSLLITDYSSVAFNVAILNKPVIYAQFDYDDFYLSGKHTSSEGYFSYEEDGFGPIVKTPEAVVDEIESLINRGFVNSEKYRKRIKEFFFYPDEPVSRAELVYREILKMGNHQNS